MAKPARKEITEEQLDSLTSRDLASLHLSRIWNEGTVAEQEVVMQLLHLLHARGHSYDRDAILERHRIFSELLQGVIDL